jgi:hypothetical protein
MLHVLAKWQGTTVDEVLTCALEGVASAYSGELADVAIPRLPDDPCKPVNMGEVLVKREQIGAGLHRVSGDPDVVARQRPPFSSESSGNPRKSIGCDERHG